MKITVFSSLNFERDYLLEANADSNKLNFIKAELSQQTASLAEGSEVFMTFVNDVADADADVISSLSDLDVRYTALRIAGLNNLDIDKAHELDMLVANVAPRCCRIYRSPYVRTQQKAGYGLSSYNEIKPAKSINWIIYW